ncbi:adenosylcobalamin-dependent ribonucleoside-diphosphate reductase [Natronococcus wangiae]|uniref:adenosylcobalamin-dependent ribonucleoside-diphosphate reductase n=1 Tax=Natronococcus wangiae TaxID=3068275 RepID=UPI00273F04AB|nr:adenosylcobalamin-dependent ribonucleoside-diphosphate reductase [Natronococcus sp. AD5]
MSNSSTPIRLPVKETRGATLRTRLSQNAYERVLPARYLLRNEAGDVIETPEEMFRRVADAVALAEREYGGDITQWADRFEVMMTDLEFVPNSPTLMNAGTRLQQLSACFVVSPDDSMGSIFETLKQAATILQTGGGVGYTFSWLRPRGDVVRSSGGTASGPVSFMRVYDTMCGEIKQGGKRRGAQMGILCVDHPDICRFLVAKRREDRLTNFNLSVGITDSFYAAVLANDDYSLVNPQTGEQHRMTDQTARFYDPAYESTPGTGDNFWRDYAPDIPGVDSFGDDLSFEIGEQMTLPARFVWTILVDGAWRNGEPGLFMLDETNRQHSFDVVRRPEHAIEATNPCGEQGLENFEACTLGHVNLALTVESDRTLWVDFLTSDGSGGEDDDIETLIEGFLAQAIDWDRLTRIVRDGTRFLDDVVTVDEAPIPQIDRKVGNLRKIGLGIMGFAELLIQLDVRYGSKPSIEIARQLMEHINRESTVASHELVSDRGPFPEWDRSKYASPPSYPDWFERHTGLDPTSWETGFPVRNHSTTTIAPCGTTSIIGNTSGGCEPLYDVAYFRNVGEDVRGDERFVEFDDYFLRVLEANDIDIEPVRSEAETFMEQGEYSGPHSLSIPVAIADAFVTARVIPPSAHVEMQAAFQEHVDSAISKTINLPPSATRGDVDEAYRLAIETGCKGITVYRDRSRRVQVLARRPIDPSGPPEDARCCPI